MTVDKRHLISGPRPVMQYFSVPGRAAKDFRPDLRLIAKELAEYLLANGFVYSLSEPLRSMNSDHVEYRFGLYAHKKQERLP